MNMLRSSMRRRPSRLPVRTILATSIVALSAPLAEAATFTWLETNSGTLNWSAGVWTPATPTALDSLATTDLIFNGVGTTQYTATNDLANPFLLNTLTLNSTATVTQTIGGNPLDFRTDDTAAGITQSASGAFTISTPIVATNPMTFSGAGTGLVTLGGVISGSSALTFSGANWRLTTPGNTMTGPVAINTGAAVELAPQGVNQSVDFTTTAAPRLLGTGALTMNGGSLKLTTTGSGTLSVGRTVTFGASGGTLDLTNTNAPGAQGGNITAGDITVVNNSTAGNTAVIRFNGGQLGLSNNSATVGNLTVGANALRLAGLAGSGAVRVELTNGALWRGSTATGDNNFNFPFTVRGVIGGDPTSGSAGLNATSTILTTGRVQSDNTRTNYNGGLTFEGAVQWSPASRATAINGNITIASNAYVGFQGRGTGTALSNVIQAPGSGAAGHNVLWIGENSSTTFTVQNGGIAVFDGRIRADQTNSHGVLLAGNAVLNAGGTLRVAQSISNFSALTAAQVTDFVTNQNQGDVILRGSITGQGTTANESVLEIKLPAPDAAGTIANGTPTPLAAAAPGAGTRPFAGLVAEPAHTIIVNGSGFGGLRVQATSRPDRLFSASGAPGGAAIPDPTLNTTKLNSYLSATRLAALTGSGGYLSPGAAGGTWTFPVGGEWGAGVTVGLRVNNANTGGTDVLMGPSTWSHNLAVDSGAVLDTGAAAFSLNSGTLFGTGSVNGVGLTVGAAANVAPGFSVGTLNIGQNLTLSGTYLAELASTTADLLAVTGNLTLGGALSLSGTYGTADLTIATYSGTLTGTFGSIVGLDPGFTINYGTGTNSTIRLISTLTPTRVWNGNVNNFWNTTTANWQGASVFSNGEKVLFDDTAAGNFAVAVNGGDVMPTEITVNNTLNAYTLTSSAGAAITGAAKLSKNGTNTLTLSGPAAYAGGTDVNAGTLRLGGSNAIPDTGAVIIAAGATLDTQGNSDTVGALTVNGSATGGGTISVASLSLGSGAVFTPNLVLNGNLTKTGATGTTLGGTIDLAGGIRTFDVAVGTAPELTANGAISNGSLTKTGNGTLVLGTVNSLTAVAANGGILRVGVAGAIPTATVNTGAGGTLDLNGLVPTIGTLNNSGTTVTGGVALTVTTLNGANTGTLNLGGGQLIINGGGGGSYAGAIAGVGTSVVKQGAGIATLTGTSTHTGGTTINAGRLNAAGAPGGTLGITVNSGAVLQFTNTVAGPIHVNAGATLSTTTGNNPVNGDLFIDGDAALHLFDEGTPATASDFALGGANPGNPTGTLRGSGNLTVSSNQASADGGAGLRLRSTIASDYSGTITAGNRVKVELNSNASGAFSPLGTGKVVLTAGTTNTPASLQGTYSQVQTRTNVTGTTTYGNNIEVTGSGAANFNVLGAANTIAVMGDLKLGGGQSMFFNKNDAATDRTIAFQTVTLTGGTATLSVYDRNFRANDNAFVGPNVQVGAIGQTTPGAGVIFKAAAGDTAVASPIPHVTVTGVSTYTGPTDIQAGPLTVSATGSLASSSEIRMSAATAKLDVLPFGAGGYNIPAAQKVSGIGDWDGRLNLSGTLAPGLSIGTLTGDNLTLNGGGIMQFELSTLDNTSDKLTLSGAFDKGTAGAFQFDFEGGGLNGQTYTLVQFATTTFAVSDFTYADLGVGLSGSFVLNANDLQFVVIPEPGSAALLVIATIGLAGFRRRR